MFRLFKVTAFAFKRLLLLVVFCDAIDDDAVDTTVRLLLEPGVTELAGCVTVDEFELVGGVRPPPPRILLLLFVLLDELLLCRLAAVDNTAKLFN